MNRDRRGLLIAVLGGSAAALLLQRSRTVGTTLPETPVIDAVLGDLSAPRSTPKGADVTLVVFTARWPMILWLVSFTRIGPYLARFRNGPPALRSHRRRKAAMLRFTTG